MPATESGLMNLKNDSPTIGIVGSNGFLGSALIEQSQKSGLNVVSIGRTAPEMKITHLYMDFTIVRLLSFGNNIRRSLGISE